MVLTRKEDGVSGSGRGKVVRVVAAMECTGGETKEGKAGAATAATAAAAAAMAAAAAGYSYCVFLQCFRTATTMCSE